MKVEKGRRVASPPFSPALRAVCADLCHYYHPEKTEETGCGGIHWLERHLSRDALSALLPPSDPGEPLFGVDPEDPRLLEICVSCEYRADGCDFRDPAVPRESCAPCGGLRAAAGLLAAAREG